MTTETTKWWWQETSTQTTFTTESTSSSSTTTTTTTMDLSREDELPYTQRLTFGDHVKFYIFAIVLTITAYLLAQELLK